MAGKHSTPEAKAASLANLRPCPFDEMDPERAKAIRRKGAAAAREITARRRALRDIMRDLLSMEYTGSLDSLGDLQAAAQEAAREAGRPLTIYEAGALAQAAQMLQGSTRAAEWVRDSAGDKPGDIVQSGGEPITAADLELLRKVAARLDGNKST